MKSTMSILVAAGLSLAALTIPALARDGGSGGDREPAGGAFMTSYPQQSSSSVQQFGPPVSADVPRHGTRPEVRGPALYAPGQRPNGR